MLRPEHVGNIYGASINKASFVTQVKFIHQRHTFHHRKIAYHNVNHQGLESTP